MAAGASTQEGKPQQTLNSVELEMKTRSISFKIAPGDGEH